MKTKHAITALLLGLIIHSGKLRAQCATFGNYPPPYNTISSISANYLLGTKFTLSNAFSLTGLGFAGNNTNSGIQMAIYTDAGNVAGNLVAYTNPSTVGSGNTTLTVTTPTVLPPGDYWIMAVYSQSGNHVFYTNAAANSTVCYISLTYGSPIPSTASWITYTSQDFNYWAVGGGVTVNTPAPICPGAAVTLSASGAASYSWNTGANTSAILVSPLTTTNYTVNGTGGACPGSAVVTVSVTQPPLLTIIGPSTVCSGSAITQTVVTTAPSFTWSGGFNGNVASYTPAVTTTITVSGTGANNCIATASTVLTVFNLPTLTSNNGTICTGSSFTIAPNETIPYTVSGGQAIVSPATTTNYTITGIDMNTGCTNMVSITVFVNPLPTITVNSSAPLICLGKTATITASGAVAYSWNTGATTSVVAVTPTGSTTYTISGTSTDGCIGRSTFTQSVTVCTGINSLADSENLFYVYPNPTKGLLHVEYPGVGRLFIYNSLGQEVFSQQNATLNYEVDITEYKPGAYYLRIVTDAETQIQKIIKE